MPNPSIDTSGLPLVEKLTLVEQLWDEIGEATASGPMPVRVAELARRRWRSSRMAIGWRRSSGSRA